MKLTDSVRLTMTCSAVPTCVLRAWRSSMKSNPGAGNTWRQRENPPDLLQGGDVCEPVKGLRTDDGIDGLNGHERCPALPEQGHELSGAGTQFQDFQAGSDTHDVA